MDWLRLEVREQRGFRANRVLVAGIFLCFWLQWLLDERTFAQLTLTGWNLPGLLAHPFIHVHSLHLLWNLLLLHLFGGVAENALGPGRHLGCFFLFASAGAAAHVAAGGGQAAGASGAVSGFVGLVIVARLGGVVALLDSAIRLPMSWLALALVLKDLVFAFLPGMGVSVMGHLGGYAAGAVVGWGLRRTGEPRE